MDLKAPASILTTSNSACTDQTSSFEISKRACEKVLVTNAKWTHLHFKVADNHQTQRLNLDGGSNSKAK